MSTHCYSGVRHEGNPEGKFDTIGGVKCYLATPIVDYSKEKIVLFLPDAFGIELVNNQLLCDDFAKNGFRVVGVDLFNGDPAPLDAMETGTFNLSAWLSKHGTDVTRPRIDNVIATLKHQGIMEFAATGYCFSARYVFDLAFDGIIKVAAVSHPSLLKIPEDLHKFKQTKVPLLINSCEIDQVFSTDSQAQADAILGGGLIKTDLYRREYFDGCTHGFAVRGDMSNPKVKAGKEGAFKAIVEFFLQYFPQS
ncbi:dienelactone hydrolase [Boletus reticuloceps]|uniref:Dienelactone hydrolase n=1 Tax=Boletus reticuloceps TaxID=495285 RepID=A0A8I3A9N3_9AGAM|nr:dienelactone hydrolase [Boletus reticuloceps]